jgi:CheY-like chemotaxis protein
MVVDDMADVRELLRDYLESEGYAVETLANASDALARLAEFRPRLILLDILMPGLSGLSAIELIRSRDPEVGIIMVTGNGDDAVAKQTLALGAFDYVSKPIDFAYLTRSIESFLLLRALLPE